MTEYVEVTPEVAVERRNWAKQFLLVDKDGYSVVLYGSQLQKARFEHLRHFRIMMVKEERN